MQKNNDKFLVSMINGSLTNMFFLLINSALLVSCSMVDNELDVLVKSELEQKLERYTELEPELQRILALESDMQIIVAELARYSTLGTDPLGTTPIKSNVQSDNKRIQNTTEENNSVTRNYAADNPSNCRSKSNALIGHCKFEIGLHIAAFSDEKSVLPGWLYLQKKLPTELTRGKRPLRTEIVQQNIAYQSLRVGPFTSVNQAKRICDGARHLVSCAVVEYLGSKVK
ncbi:hypothetical protein [Paraglaciecola arctica]|uniref:hypothetical protein n=1 Tax=Paraglaciecola arctica TaxID=1128911 RepID=UPI001C07BF15|nr:hypothetical protein [Paraglaciecola arctica]MBU3003032.1 hypothetical protein [Paraglaciecola arctica]